MKKVLMLVAIVLGTTVMVNAQTEPAKTPAKEVKTVTHAKKTKTVVKTDAAAPAAKMDAKMDAKAKK